MKRIALFAAVSGALLLILFGLAACGGGDSAKLRAQVATLQTQIAKPTLTPASTATPAATATVTATPELTATPVAPTPTATTVPPTQTPVVVFVAQPTLTVSGRTLPCTNIVLGWRSGNDAFAAPIGITTIQNRATGFITDINTGDVFGVRPIGSCYPEGGTPQKDPPH